MNVYIVSEYLEKLFKKKYLDGLEGQLVIECSVQKSSKESFQNHIFKQNYILRTQSLSAFLPLEKWEKIDSRKEEDQPLGIGNFAS
ncbi:hypothetical protein HMI54_002459 [Coelomomyces lativittatus]|nr:hypothetical protein HMI54_002459 [Coelomomyces lativittatus]